MLYEFRLPDIGEGVVEGEIVRWLVKEGDAIAADQPMVEVMTDKATVEIPAPRAGRVTMRGFKEGQICPVGAVLIAIEIEGDAPASVQVGAGPAGGAAGQAAAAGRRSGADAASGGEGGGAATPAVRRLARDLGVDLAKVKGSGPGGRITPEDVKAAAGGGGGAGAATSAVGGAGAAGVGVPVPVATHEGDVRVPLRGVRRKISEHLSRAWDKAAHVTYVEEVDATELVALRDRLAAKATGAKLSYLPFIVRATCVALRKFPRLNAALDEAAGEIVERRDLHIGVAAATDDGLLVPVVRHADRLDLAALAKEIERLALATKQGKATREELTGSTFTISSMGALGGVVATSIVNYPEVAILGVHKIAKRPAVVGGQLAIRELMNVSVSIDHRVVDGIDAARFVAAVKEALEAPAALFPSA